MYLKFISEAFEINSSPHGPTQKAGFHILKEYRHNQLLNALSEFQLNILYVNSIIENASIHI